MLIYTLNKTYPLFFNGRNLRPPGIGIEDKIQDTDDCLLILVENLEIEQF